MSNNRQPVVGSCPCCNPAIELLTQAFLSRRQLMVLDTKAFSATLVRSGGFSTTSPTHPNPPLVSQVNLAADAIYTNVEVVTVNDAQPSAEAVAVKDGKILAVGDRAQMKPLQSETTQILDMNGKVMVPGFIDAHGHFLLMGVSASVANLQPPPDGGVDTIAKLQQALRDWAIPERVSVLGWIVGNGYDDAQLAGQQHPTRDDLDAVSTELPVIAIHSSGHLAAVNSKALGIMGFTATTENPAGGVIRRQAGSNEPNGVLEESAFWAVFTHFSTPSPDLVEDAIERATEIYASFGFTTAQEGRGSAGIFEVFKQAANAGKLKLDIAAYLDYQTTPQAHLIDWSKQEYRNHLRLAGAKLNLDGSPQGKTAWMTQPYFIPPEGQATDYKGYASLEDRVVIDRVATAFENNFQVLAHCSGDAAADQYIMAVRQATDKYGDGNRRPVLVHAHTVREDQLDAMKELGIFPAFFPAHVFYWGDWHRDSVFGTERASRFSPTGSAVRRDMRFTSHNDAPVVLPSAVRLMWAAVNRRTRSNQVLGEDQRVTPLEALKSVTLWAAYQHFEEDSKGSIAVGKLADFAILSANPLSVDPMEIQSIEVLETIKEGKTLYHKVT